MPSDWSFGGVQIGENSPGKPLDDEIPLHLLAIGDFSGRGQRGAVETGASLAKRRPVLADRDSLADLPSRLNVHLSVAPGAAPEGLRIGSLEDFEPDRLLESIDSLAALLQMRRRLQNPATFAEALRELQGPETPAKAAPGPAGSTPASSTPTTPAQPGAGLFDAMLAETERHQLAERPLEFLLTGAPSPGALGDLVRSIVEPHLVARDDPRVHELTQAVDADLTAGLRAVLHDAAFQSVESAWRGLELLVRDLDQEGRVKIHVLDWSKAELLADLDHVETSVLLRLLHSKPPAEGQPWGSVVVLHELGATAEELAAIGCLGLICGATTTAATVGIHDAATGRHFEDEGPVPDPRRELPPGVARQLAETWDEVRAVGRLDYVAAAWPRRLLRLPYGQQTRSIAAFEFEEMPTPPQNGRFLWGSPATMVACLLGRAFLAGGWGALGRIDGDLAGNPLYVYRHEGESRTQAPTEHVLSETALHHVDDRGLTVLVGYRNRDHLAVPRVQAITRGPWRGCWG